jgi:hypothetical protein
VVKAIRVALKVGAKDLKVEHFTVAYRAFTGCSDGANPFVAPGFKDVVVDKYVTRLLETQKAEASGTKKVGN